MRNNIVKWNEIRECFRLQKIDSAEGKQIITFYNAHAASISDFRKRFFHRLTFPAVAHAITLFTFESRLL